MSGTEGGGASGSAPMSEIQDSFVADSGPNAAASLEHLAQGYDVLETSVKSEHIGSDGAARTGMPKAPSEGSLGGWDVLTDVPSEAGTQQTFLQDRVHELEAEVERLKLALLQQSMSGASTSQAVSAPNDNDNETEYNTAQEAGAASLADDWLLTEDAAAILEDSSDEPAASSALEVSFPDVVPPHVSAQDSPATDAPQEVLGSSTSVPVAATDTPEPHTTAAETEAAVALDESVHAPAGALDDSFPQSEEQEDQELQWAILSSLHQGPWASTPAPPHPGAEEPQNDASSAEQESGPANADHAEDNTQAHGRVTANARASTAQRTAGPQPLAAAAAGVAAGAVAAAATHAVAATAAAVHRCHHHPRRSGAEAAERRQRQWEHTAARTACALQRRQWRDVAAEARRQRMLQRHCTAAARRHHRQSVLSDSILGSIAAAFLTPLVQPCTPQHHGTEPHVGTGSRYSCKGRRRRHGQCY